MRWFTNEAETTLPTEFGTFKLVGFTADDDGKEHVALVKGDVAGRSPVPVRIHSECLTGDVLGSLRCDCRQQLHRSLEELGRSDFGVVLYLRQEGRGIGLLNKIRAYSLQEEGLDTVEANEALNFPDDLRDYNQAARMLRLLGVRSVLLKTNNPSKVEQLRWYGIQVERMSHEVPANEHNASYLETKRIRSGHLLTATGDALAAK